GASLAPLTASTPEEPGPGTFTSAGLQLVVERQGDKVIHAERLLDPAGHAIVASSGEVRFVVGSGRPGKSYLVDRGGDLFLSPVAWYRANGWGASPCRAAGAAPLRRSAPPPLL